MQDLPQVTILMINYKTPGLCCSAIQSIIDKSVGFSYEIFILDNDSEDDSEKIIRNRFGDRVSFIENGQNLGTAKAVNVGAKIAKGKYLFYVNSDTLLLNNAIKIMLDYMETHLDVAVVGCNLFNSSGRPIHSFQKKYDLPQIRRESSLIYSAFYKATKKLFSREFNFTRNPLSVDYICAAATLMRKDIFLKLGGYDEDVFMYSEESIFADACRREGYLSVNVPQGRIIHLEGNSFSKEKNGFSESRYRRYIEGNSVYFRKKYGEDGLHDFYFLSLKKQRKKMLFDCLIFKKQEKMVCEKKIEILSSYINQITK